MINFAHYHVILLISLKAAHWYYDTAAVVLQVLIRYLKG